MPAPSLARRVRFTVVAASLVAAVATPGCAAPWYRQGDSKYIVLTYVVADTDPPGAMVTFDGVQMDRAPVRIPVEYDHVEEHWARQSNYGVKIREDTGTLGTILLFPIWIPASIVQFREDLVRHTYGGNRHTVAAWADGHLDASQEITLEGEEQVDVNLHLPSREDAPAGTPPGR